MASVKNRKSKNCAFDTVWANPEYVYRKQQFADLGPAKVVKPVRALKQRYVAAMKAWDRTLGTANPVPFPYMEEARYRAALSLNGAPGAHRLAMAHC